MSRLRHLAPCLLIPLLLSCDGLAVEPDGHLAPGPTSGAIVDASTTEVERGFWWLPPMVPNPALSGTFQASADPMVRVICQETTQGVQHCNGEDTESNRIAEFTVGNGVLVEADHFKVEFDTRGYNLKSSENDQLYTTYRIIAYTSPLTEALGGPFPLGWADVRLGQDGQVASNLSMPGEQIGLVNNRTLPVRFSINEDAYPFAVAMATADMNDPYCQVNCSFTFIEPDATTIAELLSRDDDVPDGQYAALEFRPGHVKQASLLLLDQRTPETCAEVGLEQRNCVRAELFPALGQGQEFEADSDGTGVRMGLRRCDVPLGEGTPWAILKFNPQEGLTRPGDVDVSDFFNDRCEWPTWAFLGLPLGRYARAVADWLVAPAFAGDLQRAGATIRTLSDVFWAKDAELRRVSDGTLEVPVPVGVEEITVQVVNRHWEGHGIDHEEHAEPTPGLADMEVVFTLTSPHGAGGLISADGQLRNEVTRHTDADGMVRVEWVLVEGQNSLSGDAPQALGGPLVFSRIAATDPDPDSVLDGLTLTVTLLDAPGGSPTDDFTAGDRVYYEATVTNGNNGDASQLLIHGWVQQDTRRAGGNANTDCRTIAAGSECTTTGSFPTSSLTAGEAVVIVQLRQGGSELRILDQVSLDINLK